MHWLLRGQVGRQRHSTVPSRRAKTEAIDRDQAGELTELGSRRLLEHICSGVRWGSGRLRPKKGQSNGNPGVGWIAAIIIGGIAGWLAEMFMKSNMGVLMNIVLGIVGAIVANFILGLVGISLGGWIGYLIAGFIGACILIAIGRAIKR